MDSFPKPALKLVENMHNAAAADPARTIAFQGAPGANSHRAALQFAPEGLPLPCFSFEDALDAVQSDKAGCAIIPIENSQNGRVADIHFLLPESGLNIVAEHFMPIHHALMGLAGDDGSLGPFEAAYSHPQALGQSRVFLRTRNMVPLSHADTAGAAAYVAEMGNPKIAAIAPALAADLYDLQIAANNVEDAGNNTTRFVVLAKKPLDPATLASETAMTTFIFKVKNTPAALYEALGSFATNGVNMTKLESYQEDASFAATTFYTDVVGAPGDPKFDVALQELIARTKEVRILGSYRQAPNRP